MKSIGAFDAGTDIAMKRIMIHADVSQIDLAL